MTRPRNGRSVAQVARDLASIGSGFYARGWVLGTSGNFSAVLSRRPIRLAITASAVDKGTLTARHVLEVDERGQIVRPPKHRATSAKRRGAASRESPVTSDSRGLGPSAETRLHLEIVRRRDANAVLHTHSVWSTMLSDVHFDRGGLELSGYEMLKGLRGVVTHEQREWIPIVENDQNMDRLAESIGDALDRFPACHAVLLRRHGMYTWGASLGEAARHVEILEFLLETIGRTATFRGSEVSHGAAQNS